MQNQPAAFGRDLLMAGPFTLRVGICWSFSPTKRVKPARAKRKRDAGLGLAGTAVGAVMTEGTHFGRHHNGRLLRYRYVSAWTLRTQGVTWDCRQNLQGIQRVSML
jgi:hypothetical protein